MPVLNVPDTCQAPLHSFLLVDEAGLRTAADIQQMQETIFSLLEAIRDTAAASPSP